MSQGLTYNVDIVMCIDCTGSMGGLLDTVKANALKFYPDLKARCEAKGKEISDLRIRVIGFRDLGYDKDKAISDSGFLTIPEQEDKFKEIVNSLVATGGGPEPKSGLEALSMAIYSDWTHEGYMYHRHVILVWTDASTHELGETGMENSQYPSEAPANFDKLTDLWEDELDGKNHSLKRLVIFAPDASKWTEIGLNWNNTIHYPTKAGTGLEDVDYETILSIIANTI